MALVMPTTYFHAWDVSPQEAIHIQERLSHMVVRQDHFNSPETIGGADVGFEQNGAITRAAVVVLDYSDLHFQEAAVVRVPTSFSYVSGLLSFREAPALLLAMEKLANLPDLLFCDGHGLAHPRRFGLACHIGLLADIPTIGVAKSCLVGAYDPPIDERGAWQPLMDGGEEIGAALRTRSGVKPLFVSSGHRVSLVSAISLTLHCTPHFRLPEPIRQAHHLASKSDRDIKESL